MWTSSNLKYRGEMVNRVYIIRGVINIWVTLRGYQINVLIADQFVINKFISLNDKGVMQCWQYPGNCCHFYFMNNSSKFIF